MWKQQRNEVTRAFLRLYEIEKSPLPHTNVEYMPLLLTIHLVYKNVFFVFYFVSDWHCRMTTIKVKASRSVWGSLLTT